MLYFAPKLQLYTGDSDFSDASQTHVGHIIPSCDFWFQKVWVPLNFATPLPMEMEVFLFGFLFSVQR